MRAALGRGESVHGLVSFPLLTTTELSRLFRFIPKFLAGGNVELRLGTVLFQEGRTDDVCEEWTGAALNVVGTALKRGEPFVATLV
jgi:hypothetical protein